MSWLSIPKDSDFPIESLPWGIYSKENQLPRCCVALGDYVIDLYSLHMLGLLDNLPFDTSIFGNDTLNKFMELDRKCWQLTRYRLKQLLASDNSLISDLDSSLRDNNDFRDKVIINMNEIRLHLPAKIGDYTDFYSSREHATNVGIMFRGKDNALQPNWLHLPVGYHGRSSSVVLTGTNIIRPKGQIQLDKNDPSLGSKYGECNQLDFELEMAFFIGGKTNSIGKSISIDEAEDRIFGLVLMNDWSARDIQAWEYVPLGPFTAKNFATSISPWIISLDALDQFRCNTSHGPIQNNPTPLQYLCDPNYSESSYDINLQVSIKPDDHNHSSNISLSNFKHLYWNMKQQLVHHSVTGCPMNAGDLLGTGTISGSNDGSFGSMLELSWRGTKDIPLNNSNSTRKFLNDGDTVIMKGWAEKNGIRIGFGEVSGKILPSDINILEESAVINDKLSNAITNLNGYSNFKLYSYWKSSCSWRVRLALKLKGVDYEYIPIDLQPLVSNITETLSEEFKELNTMEQVPLLQFTTPNGNIVRLTQSLAIIEFLDEAFPSTIYDNKFLPSNILLKARVKEIAEIVNSGIQPLQNLRLIRQVDSVFLIGSGQTDSNGFAVDAIERGLLAIEKKLNTPEYNMKCGYYALGTSYPTLADICIIPQLENAKRFGINISKYSKLSALDTYVSSILAFQDAAPQSCPDFS